MNPTSSSSPRWLAAITMAAAFPLHGASVTLNTGDGFGTSSFNSAGNWNPAGAPAAGNAYNVSIIQLRTPADANSYTFQGDSLSMNTGGVMLYKGVGTAGVLTVANLILNGGKLDHASSFADVFTIGGGLQVTAASTIEARQGPIVITSAMTGTGALTLPATNNNNAYSVTFKGTNTYTGSIAVAGNLILDATGTLTFAIGASEVNNTISGAGSAALDGTFSIDLTNAGNTVGNQWTLVNVATLNEAFGATFNIAGFTENSGFWTSADGKYQFDEATGVLTRITADTDGDGLADSWEMTYFGSLGQGALDDPDGDYATNQLEYQDTTDPTLANSYPDTDADGLNDGWERYFFNNLAQVADGDPDGDHNINTAEQAANTDPNNAFAYPDTDSDGLNDGWEVFYFTTLAAGDPDADPDSDLFDNEEEMLSGTNPTDQVSSPDTDNDGAGDGLPDGWEVKYFRIGTETLAEVTAHQNGTGDPDADGVNNKLEYLAGTDPSNAASAETTLGYWRFEEATAGEVPAGGNGQYLYPTSIQDSSVYGNHMMAWATYSRPNYDTPVPLATIPATGATDTASLFFQRNNNGVYYIEAIFSTPTGYLGGGQALLRTHTFDAFTVEASFNTNLTGQWQVPVSKLGNPVAGQPPFSIKIDTDNKLRAGMVDGSGMAREIIGTSTIAAGSWYSTAVTGTATEMKLWLKKPGDAGYVLEGTAAISGAWHVPASVPERDTPWNIGQGMWAGNAGDAFEGNIDEVRISAVALPESSFLFHQNATPFQLWAEQTIPDAGLRGEGADPDGDGTSNLVEFRLGLDPMSGSSFFAGSLSGSTITWPAAGGVQFTIQRSTTLGGWDNVATVTANGSSASWTDLAPPSGKAFYRVVFTE